MLSVRLLKITFYLFVTAAFLAACSKSETPQVEPVSQALVAISAGEAPVGQLDKSVTPVHYRIELRIDPREDSFSGQTEIDLTLNEPRDQIWLHGKKLQVSDVWLSTDSVERIAATYEEKLESGVALITLEEPVAAALGQ